MLKKHFNVVIENQPVCGLNVVNRYLNKLKKFINSFLH